MTILYFVATIILMTLYVIGYNATEIENLEDAIQEPPQRVKQRKKLVVVKRQFIFCLFLFIMVIKSNKKYFDKKVEKTIKYLNKSTESSLIM